MWSIQKIVSKGDYNYAVVLDHPGASRFGYVLEHRVIMENHLGRILSKDEVVHHINENKKDNRIENLREATRGDNARNKSKQKNNTTGYIGVSFRKDSNKFRAVIAVNNKSIQLGSYLTAYEAALAYNEAAKRFHGKFASLNKMPQTA
jgi:hypothetical protein